MGLCAPPTLVNQTLPSLCVVTVDSTLTMQQTSSLVSQVARCTQVSPCQPYPDLVLTESVLIDPTGDDTQSQSSGDDFSVQDESGTENTDGELNADSSASSSPAHEDVQQDHDIRVSPPDTPVATKTSRASNVAASKGLNLTVTGAERGNRHSRLMPMGLPVSPRPTHSPSKTSEFPS